MEIRAAGRPQETRQNLCKIFFHGKATRYRDHQDLLDDPRKNLVQNLTVKRRNGNDRQDPSL